MKIRGRLGAAGAIAMLLILVAGLALAGQALASGPQARFTHDRYSAGIGVATITVEAIGVQNPESLELYIYGQSTGQPIPVTFSGNIGTAQVPAMWNAVTEIWLEQGPGGAPQLAEISEERAQIVPADQMTPTATPGGPTATPMATAVPTATTTPVGPNPPTLKTSSFLTTFDYVEYLYANTEFLYT